GAKAVSGPGFGRVERITRTSAGTATDEHRNLRRERPWRPCRVLVRPCLSVFPLPRLDTPRHPSIHCPSAGCAVPLPCSLNDEPRDTRSRLRTPRPRQRLADRPPPQCLSAAGGAEPLVSRRLAQRAAGPYRICPPVRAH